MHKILLEENAKTIIEHQRRQNAGFIYAISNSHWVSPVHVVPKKGEFTVIINEKNELITIRTITE